MLKKLPKSKSDVRAEIKLKIFNMLGRIVIKNINNFYYLTRDINTKNQLHTEDCLVGESWVVFDKCIEKCDLDRVDSFYYFFNTSLMREFVRIIDKNYRKHFPVSYIEDFEYEDGIENLSIDAKINLISSYIDNVNLNFNSKQKRIIKSKLQEQKVADFLEQNPDIYQNEYYQHLKIIKDKLNYLRQDNESNKKHNRRG